MTTRTKTGMCPYIMVDDVVLCLAPEVGTYRPSEFQMERFCTTHRVESCPVYGMSARGVARAGLAGAACATKI